MNALKQHLRRWLALGDLFYFTKTARFRPVVEQCCFEPFALALCSTFPSLQALRFCQIGANDGKSGDPLFPFVAPYHWEGVLYEPIPANYAKLVETYGSNTRCMLKREAVGTSDGTLELFYVENRGGLPEWVSQIAGYTRANLLAHASLCPQIPEHIRSLSVPMVDIRNVLASCGKLDILVIDVEGLETKLLECVDMASLPALVMFEITHIPGEQTLRLQKRFADVGYHIWSTEYDVIAFRPMDAADSSRPSVSPG